MDDWFEQKYDSCIEAGCGVFLLFLITMTVGLTLLKLFW
jgi:hypothetical protein